VLGASRLAWLEPLGALVRPICAIVLMLVAPLILDYQ
jgi:hypothetical protein